ALYAPLARKTTSAPSGTGRSVLEISDSHTRARSPVARMSVRFACWPMPSDATYTAAPAATTARGMRLAVQYPSTAHATSTATQKRLVCVELADMREKRDGKT